jgi:hypothetical protein
MTQDVTEQSRFEISRGVYIDRYRMVLNIMNLKASQLPAPAASPQHAIADSLVTEALVAAALCFAAFGAIGCCASSAGLVELPVCICQAERPCGIC